MVLGPVILDVAGTELGPDDTELLRHPAVGGVVLFSRNYADPGQLSALCRSIHGLREPRLLITVDQEGGRVQRFRDGFTRLPPLRSLGHLHDRVPSEARGLARELGWLMALELRRRGVDLSFAPVVDLDHGQSRVIGDRALDMRPEVVGDLAVAYMQGMAQAGMAACGKHFPGHGGVEADSHQELPVDERGWDDLMDDVEPFRRMADAGVPAMMTAHVRYPAVDDSPASFSGRWIGDVLRGRLGFQGCVVSDDLSMLGAAGMGEPADRALAALEAGCDAVLVCNDRDAAVQVVDAVDADVDAALRQARLMRLHGRRPTDDRARHKAITERLAGLDPEQELDLG